MEDKRDHLLKLFQVRLDVCTRVDKVLDIVDERRNGDASGVCFRLRTVQRGKRESVNMLSLL